MGRVGMMKAKRAGRVQNKREQWRLRRFASRDRSFLMQCNPAVARCGSAQSPRTPAPALRNCRRWRLLGDWRRCKTIETRTKRREITAAGWVADGSVVPRMVLAWLPGHVYIFKAVGSGSALQITSNDLLCRPPSILTRQEWAVRVRRRVLWDREIGGQVTRL